MTLLLQKDRFLSKIGRKALKNVQIYFPKISQRQQKRVKPEDFTQILVPLTGLEPVRSLDRGILRLMHGFFGKFPSR